MEPRVLVVSQDKTELVAIRDRLRIKCSCHPILAIQGNTAIQLLENQELDLLISSQPLGDVDPGSFCRQVRTLSDCQMLSLCRKDDKFLRVRLLNAGSDACLSRPFDWEEFCAHVRALLRRRSKQHSRFHFGAVTIDLRSGEVWRNGEPLDISWREYNLLRFLILHMNEVVSREQITEHVWQKPMTGPSRTVDQYIMKLRHQIEPVPEQPRYIITVHGYGYKFVADDENIA